MEPETEERRRRSEEDEEEADEMLELANAVVGSGRDSSKPSKGLLGGRGFGGIVLVDSGEHYQHLGYRSTMVQNSQESKRKYWATRSSFLPFVHICHSFLAPHYKLCLRTPLHSLVCSLTHSLTPELVVR